MSEKLPKLTLSWICVIAVFIDFIAYPVASMFVTLPAYELSEQGYIFIALVVGLRAGERVFGKPV